MAAKEKGRTACNVIMNLLFIIATIMGIIGLSIIVIGFIKWWRQRKVENAGK